MALAPIGKKRAELFFKDTPGIGKGLANAVFEFCGVV
jgi:hypothetical protein